MHSKLRRNFVRPPRGGCRRLPYERQVKQHHLSSASYFGLPLTPPYSHPSASTALSAVDQSSHRGYRTRSRRGRRSSSFLRTNNHLSISLRRRMTDLVAHQGRAGLVALRRYRGGTNALGRAFYKGGFEQKMNRREAALILETPCV